MQDMTLDKPIVLGARASVLAQVQARLVGDALLARNPGLHRLVHNEWVQLALLDPDSAQMQLFLNDGNAGFTERKSRCRTCAPVASVFPACISLESRATDARSSLHVRSSNP